MEISTGRLDDTDETRAEDKRRQGWQTGDTEAAADNQSQPLDVQDDPLPEGVPGKATLTKKTINDNEYWYWQWRADDDTEPRSTILRSIVSLGRTRSWFS